VQSEIAAAEIRTFIEDSGSLYWRGIGNRASRGRLLADLGAIAADAAVPLLATAAPSLLGRERLEERADPRGWMIPDPAIAEQWSDLRRSPVARWIGLALPRVLLRLPYGAATEAIESFGFEEVAGEHESLLWGHPGLACVEAIARSSMGSDDGAHVMDTELEVGDLPAYVAEVDGEKRLTPGAEYLLSLQACDAMLRHGFIPLLSYRDRNAVRIARIQSIANPPAPLSGLA
jgi:type VI secretion system protein ImpC